MEMGYALGLSPLNYYSDYVPGHKTVVFIEFFSLPYLTRRLYVVLLVLYSNICIRKVIAETGTRVPFSIPVGYPVFKYPKVRPLFLTVY